MRIYDINEKKRNNKKLNKDEIKYFVNGYVNKQIPDYQMSALLMAIYFNGMDDEELALNGWGVLYTFFLYSKCIFSFSFEEKNST